MNIELYDFREQIVHNGIIYSYCGPISHELTELIVQTLRTQTKLSKTSTSMSLKLFSVFVEMIENISHYSLPAENDKTDCSLGEGLVVVGKENDNYFLCCGNFVVTTEVETLQGRLENLQNMTKTELKSHYQKQRRKEPDASSKGAGLGFIEIARKANNFEFKIKKVDEKRSFFSMQGNF